MEVFLQVLRTNSQNLIVMKVTNVHIVAGSHVCVNVLGRPTFLLMQRIDSVDMFSYEEE